MPRVKTADGFFITYEEVLTLCVPQEVASQQQLLCKVPPPVSALVYR